MLAIIITATDSKKDGTPAANFAATSVAAEPNLVTADFNAVLGISFSQPLPISGILPNIKLMRFMIALSWAVTVSKYVGKELKKSVSCI